MNPATDLIYRQNLMEIIATDPLTDLSEETCLIIFARTTLWRHQQSQLQHRIGFRPVPTLGSHRILTLGI